MRMEQTKLIKELRAYTQKAKADLLDFKSYPMDRLNYKPNHSAWSILECIEHLNLYGDFYLPEIENRIMNAQPSNAPHFKSGLLGNYFVSIIKASSTKKMKATTEMDTTGSDLGMSTMDRSIKQLEWLDALLEKSEAVNLTKVKTAISLTKLVKLRLGDTLRFNVHHNERHILQAKRILKASS